MSNKNEKEVIGLKIPSGVPWGQSRRKKKLNNNWFADAEFLRDMEMWVDAALSGKTETDDGNVSYKHTKAIGAFFIDLKKAFEKFELRREILEEYGVSPLEPIVVKDAAKDIVGAFSRHSKIYNEIRAWFVPFFKNVAEKDGAWNETFTDEDFDNFFEFGTWNDKHPSYDPNLPQGQEQYTVTIFGTDDDTHSEKVNHSRFHNFLQFDAKNGILSLGRIPGWGGKEIWVQGDHKFDKIVIEPHKDNSVSHTEGKALKRELRNLRMRSKTLANLQELFDLIRNNTSFVDFYKEGKEDDGYGFCHNIVNWVDEIRDDGSFPVLVKPSTLVAWYFATKEYPHPNGYSENKVYDPMDAIHALRKHLGIKKKDMEWPYSTFGINKWKDGDPKDFDKKLIKEPDYFTELKKNYPENKKTGAVT